MARDSRRSVTLRSQLPKGLSDPIPYVRISRYLSVNIRGIGPTRAQEKDPSVSGASRSRTKRSEGQRKLSEEGIRASVARLQIAMDAMLDGVSILSSVRDHNGRIIDFRVDYANAAIGKISSVAAEAQVGHTLLELFPAHRANGLFEAYVGVVETGVPFEPTDFRYADPNAQGGPLDRIFDQRVARLGDGCILSVRDVTEVQRVRDERERLAAIVEESPDGIVTTDYPDMRVTYVNAAFAQDLGRRPSEVVGRSVLDVAAGALDATTIAALDEVARSGRPWLGEIDWRLTDGTLGRVELRVAPRRAADGTLAGHMVVARDVTERRRIQTALEMSELRYSTAFRTSPDAVNINRLSDGLYLDISDGFTAITGYTRDDIEGKTSADIAIWADPGTRDRLVAGLQADGVVHNLEMRFRRKDGSLGTGLMSARLIDVNGEPCNMTITRDVTDRKEAEERFRTVFDFATDAIMISEPGGNFIEVNRTACERLGYSRDDLLTMSPADISAPESGLLAAARAKALMREGWASYDTGHVRRDGTVIPVEANSTVIDLGGRKAILTIARDLTDFNTSTIPSRSLLSSPPYPPPKPPPKNSANWAISEASVAKKLARVMTITSRLITCVSSCAITPSSSAEERRSRIPRVAHTVVDFLVRPIANALGIGVSITHTRGLGRSA